MDTKPCGLLAIVPSPLQPAWAERLPEFVRHFTPAGLILGSGDPSSAMRIVNLAGAAELAVLLLDAKEDVRGMGASGVYFSSHGPDVAGARATLGSAAILGAACGFSRHIAMENAEAGADFVAFSASDPSRLQESIALSAWWDEVTLIPAALYLGRLRPDISALAGACPDFLLVEESECAGESLNFALEHGLQSQL